MLLKKLKKINFTKLFNHPKKPWFKVVQWIPWNTVILNWIKPKTKIKLTLLYQVSKDGDRTSTFYSKVSNKCPNVVLLKTNSGYECGGYTSVSWGNTNNYKRDELAFLFSLDKKKKYPLQKRKLKLCYIYLLRLFCFWKWSWYKDKWSMQNKYK